MAPIAISPPHSPASTSQSDIASYSGYAYVHWYVGNAKQVASYYIARMGFRRIAYRGLETGSRAVASHVVRNGKVTFVFTSPLRGCGQAETVDGLSGKDQSLLKEIHAHQERHGDGVKGEVSPLSMRR
jgi:4-hydroxyphenylpyruvate dioxygenase